jgi:hypothetical protein
MIQKCFKYAPNMLQICSKYASNMQYNIGAIFRGCVLMFIIFSESLEKTHSHSTIAQTAKDRASFKRRTTVQF